MPTAPTNPYWRPRHGQDPGTDHPVEDLERPEINREGSEREQDLAIAERPVQRDRVEHDQQEAPRLEEGRDQEHQGGRQVEILRQRARTGLVDQPVAERVGHSPLALRKAATSSYCPSLNISQIVAGGGQPFEGRRPNLALGLGEMLGRDRMLGSAGQPFLDCEVDRRVDQIDQVGAGKAGGDPARIAFASTLGSIGRPAMWISRIRARAARSGRWDELDPVEAAGPAEGGVVCPTACWSRRGSARLHCCRRSRPSRRGRSRRAADPALVSDPAARPGQRLQFVEEQNGRRVVAPGVGEDRRQLTLGFAQIFYRPRRPPAR